MKKEERFEIVNVDGEVRINTEIEKIFVDKETGVNYLFISNGHAGGLTPLLDAEGKPVITKGTAD